MRTCSGTKASFALCALIIWVVGSAVERQTDNLEVDGSTPSRPTNMTEAEQEYNPLQEARDAISEARERIAAELAKEVGSGQASNTPQHTWFDCYTTVAAAVTGALELGILMGQITGPKVETWNKNSQELRDRLKEINKEGAIHEVNRSSELQEELLKMLDVFREENTTRH